MVVKGTPDKFGCMFKQSSGRDVFHWYGEQVAPKDLTKKKRRWFMLKETFLAYFKNAQDETPAGIVPLDYYVMRISDEKAREKCLILERYPKIQTSNLPITQQQQQKLINFLADVLRFPIFDPLRHISFSRSMKDSRPSCATGTPVWPRSASTRVRVEFSVSRSIHN